MFLDTFAHGEFPGDGVPTCRSCRGPITAACTTAELHFDPDPVHRLEEMNGLYHAVCAQPYLSLHRALTMLGRGGL